MNKASAKQVIKIFKQNSWMVQEFNALPFYLLSTGGISGWMLGKLTGVNYSHFLINFRRQHAKFFYDEADLERIGQGFFKRIRNRGQLRAQIKAFEHAYAAAVKRTEKFAPQKLRALSLAKLTAIAGRLRNELTMGCGIGHTLEGIAFVSETKLKTILEKRRAADQKNLSLLSSAGKASLLAEAQKLLLKISRAQGKKRDRLVKKFLSAFGWIENNYVRGKTLTAADVLAKSRQQSAPPAGRMAALYRAKQNLIKKLRLNSEEKFVIQAVEDCALWQDRRKKFMLESLGRIDPVLKELAARLRLPADAFKYLCPQELTYKHLANKNFLDRLRGRYPQSSYFVQRGRAQVFTGKDAKFISKSTLVQNKKAAKLSGLVAHKGLATGKVRLCLTLADIGKIKPGEILITFMTRPEFLPAMQKAAAFVTDEGGITSHASIISREMNKPCIIGTKIATQVFKDGDLVEVDANQGIVKKLQ